MNAPALLHYVSLDGAGGVELQFVDFVAAAAGLGAPTAGIVACGRRIHPLVAERLPGKLTLRYEKYAGRFKLPKWPPAIRRARQRRLVERSGADAVLIWNRLRDSVNTLEAAGSARCVYWERGAAWFADVTPAKTRFLAGVRAVLANSHAARRMLERRWGYRGPICVIPNALRPAVAAAAASAGARTPPVAGWRLGVAARLQSIKGVAIALHALAALVARGWAVTLDIAGDGPERERLAALSASLGLSERVTFCGLVADMGAFYADIDILVHPALREPFGQVVIEAGAFGVPAVVAAVDGLAEVVADDISGVCVVPAADCLVYAELGGATDDLPPYVYHPGTDAIDRPRVVEPGTLAEALAGLMYDGARYRRLSAGAIARVHHKYGFDRHLGRALGAIQGFVATGELVAP